MTERRLLEVLRERLAHGASPRAPDDVRIDIGDDAAVLAAGDGDVVLSVDAAVEGVHFRRAWLPLARIAARAFAAALSDLAAMGSRPRGALVALALPRGTTEAEVADLADGLAEASRDGQCPIVGGNLTRATELSITTTVVGEGTQHLTRGGARVGDALFVSGVIGASALGLAVLSRDARDSAGAAAFVERFARPVPRIALGLALSGRATSAIDVSDGLAADLAHLLEASGVAAELEEARLPLASGHVALAATLGLDPVGLALDGGEDYELLFTLPPNAPSPEGTTRIGRIVAGAGNITLVGPDGGRRSIAPRGHDHFG